MYSGFLLVKEQSYHQGGTHTGMEEADRHLGREVGVRPPLT